MAKRALTDAAIKRLKPPAKGQVDIFDRGYPGLALRVSYGGNRSWVVFYRHGGKTQALKARHLSSPFFGGCQGCMAEGQRGCPGGPATLQGFGRSVLGLRILRG